MKSKDRHNLIDGGPMLNVYPDSVGGSLSSLIEVMSKENIFSVFDALYILPSMFHSDLDRGFSVIDYGLNEDYVSHEDLQSLEERDISLKLDFVLNHLSARSPQFQDLLINGPSSRYQDFFIDWNKFWKGNGKLTPEGFIVPEPELIKNMFFRKPGLPILMVPMPDGTKVPYWNTFYQKMARDGQIQGQMDLNIKSDLVWEFYDEVLKKLSDYGSKIVRLDAFAYAPKEIGERNFLNDPGTWELLKRIRAIAERYGLKLLPEIHASYQEGIHEQLSDKGYLIYDFFLPGLIIDALENKRLNKIIAWANELWDKNMMAVNMLGCHDGIPLLDLKGMLDDSEIEDLIDIVTGRGGHVKNLHGQKNVYYQVNAAYYSALGEDDDKLLLARALQLFMPGKPQVWYLDLFAGKNDYEGMKRAGSDGHKEINRTNLSVRQVQDALEKEAVRKQIEMLKFRNEFPAFSLNSKFTIEKDKQLTVFKWESDTHKALLRVDISNYRYEMLGFEEAECVFRGA